VALVAWLFVPVTHLAPAGDVLEVVLPDGSVATLNGGSELSHRRSFWSGRAVALEGEAFFQVETGSRFEVLTHNASVEVLGTAFNVLAWPADGSTDVAVTEGQVRVENDQSRSLVLEAGDVAEVGSDVSALPVDAGRRAAWRSGAVSFQDRPLGSVLDEVERRYGIALEAAPSVPLDVRVTAYYTDRPDIDALLGDLGAAAGVRFTPTAQGYRVRASRPVAPPPPAVQS
ncbi:FecR family protein, partial [Rubrivirga sp.]|uniref:FecR family protein n=1 Tax=Rubrivirga sp. TaxID=1885344 RepID=UPI003C78B103